MENLDPSIFLVDRDVDMSEWDNIFRETISNGEENYRPMTSDTISNELEAEETVPEETEETVLEENDANSNAVKNETVWQNGLKKSRNVNRPERHVSDDEIWNLLTNQDLDSSAKRLILSDIKEEQIYRVCQTHQVSLEGWEDSLPNYLCPLSKTLTLTLKQQAIRSILMNSESIHRLMDEHRFNPIDSQIFGTQYLDILDKLLCLNYHHILGISLQPHHHEIIALIQVVRKEAQLVAQYLELASKRAKLADIDRLLDHSHDLYWYASGHYDESSDLSDDPLSEKEEEEEA